MPNNNTKIGNKKILSNLFLKYLNKNIVLIYLVRADMGYKQIIYFLS